MALVMTIADEIIAHDTDISAFGINTVTLSLTRQYFVLNTISAIKACPSRIN